MNNEGKLTFFVVYVAFFLGVVCGEQTLKLNHCQAPQNLAPDQDDVQ